MTSSVSSSYEQTRIFYAVLASNNFHGNNFSSILEASDNISSDYEKSRVLSQVINHKNLEDKYYNELIEAVSTISSRYEKAKLLMAMVPNLPDDAGIKETFLEVAEDLSDSDYGKIMRALIN